MVDALNKLRNIFSAAVDKVTQPGVMISVGATALALGLANTVTDPGLSVAFVKTVLDHTPQIGTALLCAYTGLSHKYPQRFPQII